MSGVNRVILIGNLGKDPEIRHLENGRARATFTLATNEIYKNKEGEKVTHTDWHNIVLWTPLAEIAEKYLTKGKQVYIEGKLTNRSYTDKEGQAKYITEIVGQNLVLLGSKEGSISDIREKDTFAVEEETGDDLPF
jgi:single-strand DNA-binding protein